MKMPRSIRRGGATLAQQLAGRHTLPVFAPPERTVRLGPNANRFGPGAFFEVMSSQWFCPIPGFEPSQHAAASYYFAPLERTAQLGTPRRHFNE
jgi:rubredoxin